MLTSSLGRTFSLLPLFFTPSSTIATSPTLHLPRLPSFLHHLSTHPSAFSTVVAYWRWLHTHWFATENHALHSVTAGDGRQAVATHKVPRAVRRWRAAMRGVAAWWSAQYNQWGCRVPWNACSENNAQDEELKRTQVRACSCTSTH